MVDRLTTIPRVIGPFFVHSVSLDTMELASDNGLSTVPTYSFTLDVQDAGNNIFQIGIGVSAETLRDIVLACQSALATDLSGTSPRKV